MMAFAPLPAAGDMLGNPILLQSDATGPNDLTVILDDVTNAGFVTATITTNDGQTGQYFNFSGISYSASNDTDGSVRNAVRLWTSYEANLAGFETAPADDAEVGLSTTWVVDSHFGPGGATVPMVMLNADALTVTSGVIGGNSSTIAGEFESPTLPPDLDATTGASITLISGTGVTGANIDGTADFEPIVAYTLSITSQTAGFQPGTDIFTVGDLTINAAGSITLNGLLKASEGNVAVETTSGQILLDGAELHALEGSITLRALKEGVVQVPATAQNPRWQDYIVAEEDVTIAAGGEVVLIGGVRSVAGGIAISSTDRDIDLSSATALLHAVAGSVSVTTVSGAIAVGKATAGSDITAVAGHGSATVADFLAAGDIAVTAHGNVQLFGTIRATTGDIAATSGNGGINVAAVVRADAGSVNLKSNLSVNSLGGGIDRIDVLSGGSFYDYAVVTVAPPASGTGRAALARANIVSERVVSIDVIDPGYGYTLDEQVQVTIVGDETRTVSQVILNPPFPPTVIEFQNPGGTGASAVATATSSVPSITAKAGISVSAGSDVTLGVDLATADGGIALVSEHGDIATGLLAATSSGVSLTALSGAVSIQQITADSAIAVSAAADLAVTGAIESKSSDVALRSRTADVTLSDSRAAVSAGGQVMLASDAGSISTPNVLAAQGSVAISAAGRIALNNDIISKAGNIAVTSFASSIIHNANVNALGGTILLDAKSSVASNTGGITSITVVSGGGGYSARTQVTIAAPAAGGYAATARPVIVSGVITGVILVDPGTGYAPGERPEVTVSDVAPDIQPDPPIIPGSGAVLYAESGVPRQSLYSGNGISVLSHDNILLFGKNTSIDGDVTVKASAGDVDLGTVGTLLEALGGRIEVTSLSGSVVVNALAGNDGVGIAADAAVDVRDRIWARDGAVSVASAGSYANVRNLRARDDIVLSSFQTATLSGEVATEQGDINFASNSGGLFLAANLVAAEGAVNFSPHTFFRQQDATGIEAVRVLSAGSVITAFPDVTVTIAPPSSPGGEQAAAEAVIGQRVKGGGPNPEIEYYISMIRITSAGRGYALGENPIVTIEGIDGATAVGVGPQNVRDIWARQGVELTAGSDVTLVYAITSEAGDVSISSSSGSVESGASTSVLNAIAGSVSVFSEVGAIAVSRIVAGTDAVLAGHGSVTSATAISVGGDVSVVSASGNVSVNGQVYADAGDITLVSTSGSVALAANVHSNNAAIGVTALGGIFQRAGSGVQRIAVLYGGESDGNTPPVVTVGVAPPKGGGIAAQAFATLRSFTNAIGQTRYAVDEILITNPGRGYEIGEAPEVTIDGIDGAAAIAQGPEGYQDIVAAKDIVIVAGETVVLANPLHSEAGNVSIVSTDGTLSLGAQDQLLRAVAGGVTLDAKIGRIEVNRVYAMADATIRAGQLVSLVREVVSETGDIVATSDAGSVLVAANVLAQDGAVRLVANHQVRQTSQSGISGIEVVTGGQFVGEQNAPTVSVTIAAPAGGGVPAEAVAISAVTGFTREFSPRPIWSVQSILITNPGSGYAIGERPLVTISGIPGALAVATGPAGMQSLVAEGNVEIAAGDDILLVDTLRSNLGDVSVSSSSGSVDLGTPGQVLHSVTGAISVTAEAGAIEIYRAYANDGIAIRGGGAVTLHEEIVASDGDIIASSISGSMFITANVHAIAGGVDLSAHQSMVQTRSTGVADVEIVSPGSFASLAAPNVQVTIAAPAGFGRSAVAQAIVNPIGANAAGVPIWGVTEIVITDPGSGYAVGERPLVTITGVTGAIAIAFGPTGSQTIVGEGDVSLAAGNDIAISTIVRSSQGDVTVASIDGNLDLSEAGQLIHAISGGITLMALGGSATVQQLTAGRAVAIESHGSVVFLGDVDAAAGDVTITSRSGNLDFTASEALIYADAGDVTLTAASGSILTAPTFNVGGDVTIRSLNTVALRNEITSDFGDIAVESISGSITTNANINAITGSVTLDAHGAVTQLGRGIQSVEVLTGGSGYNAATTVAIAAPVGGGVTATARPVIGANGAIIGIVIVNPGSGYGVNEQPVVTITAALGFPASGANALAHVTQGVIAIAAGEDVTIDAGNGVTLINPVNTINGDVVIETVNGNVDASGANVIIGSQNGGVAIDSVNGTILMPPVLKVAGDIALRVNGSLSVLNNLTSATGSLTLESRTGGIAIGSGQAGTELFADDRITLIARNGVTQNGGFIQARELVVNNATTQPVTLTSTSNDVEYLSIRSLGAVAYTDANDFETGVNRTGVLGVEVEGDAISLASLAPYSTVRVVSGLKYRTLAISAGANTPSTVGTVEFVTTSSGDNATTNAAFQGSLRDMIRYANDNAASYVINSSRKQQPQTMVFDEDGYAVSEITVNAALPQFTRTVTFDGGRLESTVAADRLGLRGNLTAETGLAFGAGSNESRVTRVAAYGFDAGAGIALFSGGNVVTDVYAGLMADGVTRVPNRVGIDVNGRTAVGNVIGNRVFDESKVNRIVANKASGIVIRNGASTTNVSGNRIYDNLGDGVRIVNSNGNWIGDPRAVQPDMLPTDSNIIAGNRSHGILVLNSNPGTYANANRIRNNLIEANQGVNIGLGAGAGIGVRGSKFAVIGGPTDGGGNTIVNQGPVAGVHGIAVADSTDVRVIGIGNSIGVDPSTLTRAPNSGDGINIQRSQRVEISDRNTIAANAGNGIGIGIGSSEVTVLGNSIGLAATDPSRDDLGNTLSGVAITDAIGNTIGAGNAIAFNNLHGVNVTNSRATLPTGNRVLGSEIFANFKDGIRINGGSGTTVGGTKAGEANVIRGNVGSGIRLERTLATGAATGNVIQGNMIGSTANREVDPAMGNGQGGIRIVAGTANTVANANVIMNNQGYGVELLGGSGNVVGGASAAVGNMIANNTASGVRVGAAVGAPSTMVAARGHVVSGNTILENDGSGVEVDGTGVAVTGVVGTTIGQTVTATKVSGVGNVIEGNKGVGIYVGRNAQQVSFQGNVIADNEGGAAFVAPGANRSSATAGTFRFERQVWDARTKKWIADELHRDHVDQSVLLRASAAGSRLEVYGMFSNSTAKQQQYSIDVYANSPYDKEGVGGVQHRRLLGRVTVMADANGVVDFRRNPLVITAPVEAGEVITLTATSLRLEAGSTVILNDLNRSSEELRKAVVEHPGIKNPF